MKKANMKTLDVKHLDKNNKEIANILISLGMRKKMARTLAYLQSVYEATVMEIKKGTGMNLSDIYDAIRDLRRYDWISEREEGIPEPGKGKQPNIISLRVSFNEIIALLENNQKLKINDMKYNIERLRTLRK